MSDLFKEKLMTHDYPECGPGSIEVEKLYQAFRKRLMAEALARARRDTKLSLVAHFYDGWTTEQHRHWVETGERPQ